MKKSSTMLSGTETTVLRVVSAKTFPPSPYFSDMLPLEGLWIFLEYWLVPDFQSLNKLAVKFRLVAFNEENASMEEFEWGYITPDAVLGRHIALGPPTSLPTCIGNTRDWSFTCTAQLPPGDIKLIPFDPERYHTSPGLDDVDLEGLKEEIQLDPDLHVRKDDSETEEGPVEDESNQKLPPDKVKKNVEPIKKKRGFHVSL